MADIDIERKKKSPFPWIVGLLALALLAFLLMRSCGDDDPEPATAPVTDTTTAPAAAPITDTTTAGAAGAAGAAAAGAGAGWIGTVLAGTNAG